MQNEAHDCVKPTEGKHVWESLDENGRQAVPAFCEQYREFLSVAKTERETVDTLVSFARVRGFSPLEERDQLKPGDRVFMVNRNKAVAMAVIGSELLEKGLNIVGSHVDVPRLDLKPRPLYEESGLALLKTHYYGGIKKYQWVAIPLALHGVVVKGDGQMISLVIGEKVSDPVFTIADLFAPPG